MPSSERAGLGRIRKVSIAVTIGPFDGRGWIEHGVGFTAYRWAWFRLVIDRKPPRYTDTSKQRNQWNATAK